MNTRNRKSGCRTFLTASRTAATSQAVAMLAVAAGHSAINLSELARAIAADRNLCRRVTQAAFEEFGWPGLSIEKAIVLLGRERLVTQFLRLPHLNNTAAPARKLYPVEPFQREPE
jgi:hypothetical protein